MCGSYTTRINVPTASHTIDMQNHTKNIGADSTVLQKKTSSKNMRKWIILFALLPMLVVSVTIKSVVAYADTGTISWGVNPNTQERTPEPPSGGAQLLKEYDGFFVADTLEKKVYFTFDLGYEAGYTAEVLDILAANNIKGVFFLCGNYLKETALINRMVAEGHEIGNHTDRHKDLPTLSADGITKDIVDFDVKYKEAFAASPAMRFFRPPQGKFCANTLKIAQQQNLATMMWSIAIVDWGKTPIDASKCAKKIADRLHPGAIILLHITNSGTPEMLRQLLPQMSAKGYTAGNVAELALS